MKWLITKNNQPVKISDIPALSIGNFCSEIIEKSKDSKRVISLFYLKPYIYTILADDEKSNLLITSTQIDKNNSYPSITKDVPAFNMFERALYEETGIIPLGHPWLKPVRYPVKNCMDNKIEDYPFYEIDGESLHEVGVGPVHAGVIEPGHFRFICSGEKVLHLEIQLGYQHRGIENLMLKKINKNDYSSCLAESIAGDTTIAHNLAFVHAMETLLGIEVSSRAMEIRGIALELERAAIHIGDLSALAGDIAFLMGNSVFQATRTLVINLLLSICGSRFGRGLIKTGGVNYDIESQDIESIKKTLIKVLKDVEIYSEMMFSQATVLSRLEETGTVTNRQAQAVGLVGLAARASGVNVDIRQDHPSGVYNYSPVFKRVMESGDVFARSYLRYLETIQSLKFVMEHLDNLSLGELSIKIHKKLKPESLAVSMVEGWRGEIVHVVATDKKGKLIKYKIKDPSFNNWMGLALAVRNNEISDFPLCNKSFNLSYCGFDL